MNKKKANMMYWDEIDDMAEDYVRALIKRSSTDIYDGSVFDEDEMDDEIMNIGKEITEFATKLLEERFGAEFPYVDENY